MSIRRPAGRCEAFRYTLVMRAPIQSMKDCSVVTANYDLGGGLRGTVGIIGPKRMDYEKVLGTLKNLMNQLDAAFKKDER